MSIQSLKNWKGTIVVMGADWGDSGKGRLIDDLAGNADIVARYNGGSNTGHTVENDKGKFGLHIMPSGIFHKDALCVIGRNVAVDLESLSLEMDQLDKANVNYEKLLIDYQASLTMPWHKKRDGIREKYRANLKVGTTGKGVGPTYADRTERVGLLVADLISPDFEKKLKQEVAIQNNLYNLKVSFLEIFKEYKKYKHKFSKYVGDTTEVVQIAKSKNKNILFEGAQGYFLDIDAGTYPFVTSSNPGVVGVSRSFGITSSEIDDVIGITKAYTTRVGSGPMPSRIKGKESQHIIKNGNEVGTTTGRVREPGWLDLVLLKTAVDANKITALAVTKLDVLSGLKKIKLCVGYMQAGKSTRYKPHDAGHLEKVVPIYKEYAGWNENLQNCKNRKDLPKNARRYLEAIEKISGVAIKFVGVGPKRGQVIYD